MISSRASLPDKSVRWQTTLKSDLDHTSGRTLKPIANGGVLVLGDAYPDECTTPDGDTEVRRGFVARLDERGTLLWHARLPIALTMPDLGVHDARLRCSRCADSGVDDAAL